MILDYEFFMGFALKEAYRAYEIDEVPIGAIIINGGEVIGSGFNQRNKMKNTIYHAEIIAINEACKNLGDWRLEGCEIFVTVEPCPMCAGAILQSRIDTVVFGARNIKAGCCGSIINLLQNDKLNHKSKIISGVLEEECSQLMKEFFRKMRNQK